MEKVHQKMNGFGNKKDLAGFGLLEFLVALFIIGLLTGAVIMSFRKATPADQLKEFAAVLNTHMSKAWQKAILSKKDQKVIFDLKNNYCWSKEVASKQDGSEDQEVVPDKKDQLARWDESIEFVNFYIDGEDEIAKYSGSEGVNKLWLFITSRGIAQPIVINASIKHVDDDSDRVGLGLVLNPFSPQFRLYDEFKHPDK